MPPMTPLSTAPLQDPIEFSVEDAMLNTWVEDTSVYLRLDAVSDDAHGGSEHSSPSSYSLERPPSLTIR